MTEQEVKDSLGIASRKIKDEMIPTMTNVLMDAFQYGLNVGTELGVKIVNDKFDSKTQSCIKWQTGEPKDTGEYLVCLKNSRITTSTFLVTDGCWGATQGSWQRFNELYITAWCPLSDIEPYKEETK